VRASATILAGLLAATSLLAVAPASASTPTKRTVNVAPAVAGSHKVFAVLLSPTNVPQHSVDASQTAAKVATSVSAASTYWSKQSAGKVSFALAGTTEWTAGEFSCNPDDGQFGNFLNEAVDLAAAELGYEAAYNTHLLIVTPAGSDCNASANTLASTGTSVNTGGYVINAGTDSAASKASLIKGLGLNLSLGEANLISNDGESEELIEAGDVADALGTTESNKSAGPLSSAAAIASGIWPSSAYSAAALGSSTHVLKPLGGAAGKRAVVVEGNNGVNYFVEYRTVASGVSGASVAGVRILTLDNNSSGFTTFKNLPGSDTNLLSHPVAGVVKSTYVTGEQFVAPGIMINIGALTTKQATVGVVRGANPISVGTVKALASVDLDGNVDTVQVGDVYTAYLSSGWEADSYSYQWYRGTTKIAGATKASYTLAAADISKRISVSVTPRAKNQTSTAKIFDLGTSGLGYGPVTAGVQDSGTVSVLGVGTALTAKLAGWTTPGTKLAYQWFRNSTAIAKATKASYTPVSADRNQQLSVRVVSTRSGFNTVVLASTPKSFTTTVAGTLSITGAAYRVGEPLSVNQLEYSTVDGIVASPVLKLQWYRGTSAISGATSSSYTPTATDFGKKLTVKVTGGVAGNINPTVTSAATPALVKGVFAGTLVSPVVVPTSTGLSITYPTGSITTPAVSYSYQWYRDGAKIAGASRIKYVLTSADANKNISVVVGLAKANYTSVVLPASAAKSYTIAPSGLVSASSSSPLTGHAVTAILPSFLVHGETYLPSGSDLTFQWFANGTKITGATNSSFTPLAAQVGKTLTVTVTVKKTGYLTTTISSVATAAVVAP
jgi:hypothetical protein